MTEEAKDKLGPPLPLLIDENVTNLSNLVLSDAKSNSNSSQVDSNPDRNSNNIKNICDVSATSSTPGSSNLETSEESRPNKRNFLNERPSKIHSHSHRNDPPWRSSEEHPEYKPSERVLSELAEEYIFPLKKKSLRFTKAKYFCRLCDYHCDTVVICRKHIRDNRHVNLKEMKFYENNLRLLPPPSNAQIEHITSILENLASEQLLPENLYEQRRNVVRELEEKLATYVPGVSLAISGSTLSGFAIKSSNLDIDIVVPPDVKPSTALLAVQNIVQNDDTYTNVVNDLSSRFPCMYCVHKNTGISMVVGTDSPQARNTNTLLHCYTLLDPRVKKLIACLKYWAKLCKIDSQSAGTLPSHAYSIIGVHFLQHTSPPVLPCLHDLHPSDKPEEYLQPSELNPPWQSSNTDSLGMLWIMLLYYYCMDLKSQFVTSIRSKQLFIRKEKTWNKRLAIEDPFHQKRNLACTLSSSHVMDYILGCFKNTYRYFVIPQMSFGYLFKFVHAKNHKNVQNKFIINGEMEGIKSQNHKNLQNKDADANKLQDNLSGSMSDEEEEEYDDEYDDGEQDERLLTDNQENGTPKKIFVKETSIEKLTYKAEDEIKCNCEDSYLDISINDIQSTLERPSICLAKKLIQQIQKEQLFYEFIEKSFNCGVKVPLYCSSCKKSGHTKSSCTEYDLPPLTPFPHVKPVLFKLLDLMLTSLKEECEPTIHELKERDKLVKELELLIRHSYPTANLKLFGSSSNGFGFANSDLDICLSFKDHSTGEGLNFIQIIENLSDKLKRSRLCGHVLAITTAKVPIVKFTLRSSIYEPSYNFKEGGIKDCLLEADLSLYNTLALQNTRLLYMYSRIDPRVKILGYGMKYFAKLCNIGDASRGSLSSYAYIIIVLHFLQQCRPPIIPVLQELYPDNENPKLMIDGWNAWFYDDLNSLPKCWSGLGQNRESIGELWIGLLRYYTEVFDWNNNVITIRQLAPLTRLEKLWTTRCIAMEDPFDLSHNLGAGLSRKMNTFIMKTFIKGRQVFAYTREIDLSLFEQMVGYFFDPKRLTDGAPPNDRGCRFCGRIGHIVKDCLRKKEKKKVQTPEHVTSPVKEKRRGKFGKGPEAQKQLLQTLPKDSPQMKPLNDKSAKNCNQSDDTLIHSSKHEKSPAMPNDRQFPNLTPPQNPFQANPQFLHQSPVQAKTIDPNTLFHIANKMGGGTVALSDISPFSVTKKDTLGSISVDKRTFNSQASENCRQLNPAPPPGFSPHGYQPPLSISTQNVSIPAPQLTNRSTQVNSFPNHPLNNSLSASKSLPNPLPPFGNFLNNSQPLSLQQLERMPLTNSPAAGIPSKMTQSPGHQLPRFSNAPHPLTEHQAQHNIRPPMAYTHPLPKNSPQFLSNNVPQNFTDTNAFMSLFMSKNSGIQLPVVPETHYNLQNMPNSPIPSNIVNHAPHLVNSHYSEPVPPPPGIMNNARLNNSNQLKMLSQSLPVPIPAPPHSALQPNQHSIVQGSPMSSAQPTTMLDFGFGSFGNSLPSFNNQGQQGPPRPPVQHQQEIPRQNVSLHSLQKYLFPPNHH